MTGSSKLVVVLCVNCCVSLAMRPVTAAKRCPAGLATLNSVIAGTSAPGDNPGPAPGCCAIIGWSAAGSHGDTSKSLRRYVRN